MGDDPATSVVDADLKVHGCSNLYVLGSGNFVTGGASHPTLAIVALAHRLSERLLDELPRIGLPAAVSITA
jgi:choline dehydrogenase-like flavoprotein